MFNRIGKSLNNSKGSISIIGYIGLLFFDYCFKCRSNQVLVESIYIQGLKDVI